MRTVYLAALIFSLRRKYPHLNLDFLYVSLLAEADSFFFEN